MDDSPTPKAFRHIAQGCPNPGASRQDSPTPSALRRGVDGGPDAELFLDQLVVKSAEKDLLLSLVYADMAIEPMPMPRIAGA